MRLPQSGPARRAAAYVIFLATGLMVAAIGLTAVAARRVELRRDAAIVSADQARLLARSAIELGLNWMAADRNWRKHIASTPWNTDLPIAGGTLRVQVTDPVDGDIANKLSDPVILRGAGVSGDARQVLQVTLGPNVVPLSVLRAALHAEGGVTVLGGSCPTFIGGPLWSSAAVVNQGWIIGDVEAPALGGSGFIVGSYSKPRAHTDPPADDVWEHYASVATNISHTGDLTEFVLAPGYNPWGSPNANGVYLIDTGNTDLRISDARIHGTLLVHTGSRKLILDGQMLLHPARSDYAVLIVKGNLELRLNSVAESLSESAENVNFNRLGAPYEDVSDADKNDTYPNRIQGLVYVTGAVTVKESTRINGMLLAVGAVTIEANPRFQHDSALLTNPPEGFSSVSFAVQPGSWTRVVD